MKKYALFVCILFIAFSFVDAEAKSKCHLKKIPFGGTAEKIVKDYKFSVSEMPENNIFFTIDVAGSDLCKELTVNTEISFAFIEDKLVRVSMKLPGETGILKAIAEDVFGKIKQKHNDAHKDSGNIQNHWSEGKILALYSSQNAEGAKEEYLEITSKGFEKHYSKLNSLMENGDEN